MAASTRASTWRPEAFAASLAGRSPHTRSAYEHDVAEFVDWAERGGCADPAALDHRTLRRFLAYLDTRGFARSTIARKAAALRAYLRFLRRQGVIDHDPGRHAAGAQGRQPPAPGDPHRRGQRPARRRRRRRSTVGGRSGGADDPVAVAVVLRDLAVLEVLYGAGTARRRVLRAARRRLRPRPRPRHRARQGLQGAPGADRRTRRRRAHRVAGVRPPGARHARLAGRPRVPQPAGSRAHAARRPPHPRAASACPTGGPSTRTRCATPTLRTCSKAEPTSGQSRSSSATQISPPPRSTPTSPATGSAPSTKRPTLVPDDPTEAIDELWTDYKSNGHVARARAPDPPLLAAGEVRRRTCRRRSAAEHRAGRPRELRDLRAHRRHRQVRPGPGLQVRDLRDLAHQGRHHRRAALDRLGAALGAGQGPGDRTGDLEARERAAPQSRKTARSRPSSTGARASSPRRSRRSRSPASSPSTTCSPPARPTARVRPRSATPSPTASTTRSRRTRSTR